MNSLSFSGPDIKRILRPRLSSPFVFLETALFTEEDRKSYLFSDFSGFLVFNGDDDLDSFFQKAQRFLSEGFWLCGYFSYELGYFLEPALSHLRQREAFPLAWLGICKSPKAAYPQICRLETNRRIQPSSIFNIRPSISQREYSTKIRQIKRYIEQGLTYQVNFTFKVDFDFRGSILDLYLDLKNSQPTSYMALINTGDCFIISFSPELFFRKEGERIITRPMKGTCRRGLTLAEDEKNRRFLSENEKIKSENLMILDLLRNDISKISEEVNATRLFSVEKHNTLYQMTSSVEGRLRAKTGIKDIFCSLFPSGSVTGAPKIKTMEIIRNLEAGPRKVYTGAIGYVSPNEDACFNVAIRTALIKNGKGELGIGGGIVYDSCAKSEYEEALLKAKFLMERFPPFSLIESILWRKGKGYFLLALHIKRLSNSCHYFSIPLDLKKLRNNLKMFERRLRNGSWKVRVFIDHKGGIVIKREALGKLKAPLKINISSERINPDNIFLYHKTTQREFYDEEQRKASSKGFSEAIFLNVNDEVTEGTFTNIFVLKKGKLLTPKISCGLLGGVLREHLLREGKAEEKIIHLNDLIKADEVFIGNSVRGLLEAKLFF